MTASTIHTEQAEWHAADASHDSGPLHILMVEDDSVTSLILSERLKSSRAVEFRTWTAATLADALEQLSRKQFDLILLDLILPDSVGLGTLRNIREVDPRVPVVVLTGCDDEDLAISALQQGAQDYLVKGVDDGLLIRSVRYAIERTRAETKLEESQEALLSTQMHLMQVEKLDSVGRLAAGIAHEIRNPLAVIQMGVDVLRQTRFGTDKTSKEILADMSEAIQRAGSIISGLLDFCMPTPLEWTPASINRIVEEALVMLTHELRIAEVDLTVSLQEDLPELNLDHHRMQEVVITLVINALDAMSPKGNLKIATSLQLLDDAHPLVRAGNGIAGTSVVLLEVLDSGTGIPRDVLGKIFDPFFTTKQVGQGTGLGLSICKNIIELHGGRITLENRREGGARASIIFVV